ncbi:hypothetical protein [Wolbachia endosymbiont (group A) of Gastracanthus pulcherrimus]|uniref:hypothetical protein n=1 Tax=Wolbachia endosymbiont (group A) of Gastracanthus pulcherrimus TaxID=3066200 RepID=UPI00334061DF
MNKHLRVTSAGRVSSQCLTLLSFVIPVLDTALLCHPSAQTLGSRNFIKLVSIKVAVLC